MNRSLLLRALAVLVLAGAGAWLVQHTEWEETRQPLPLSDELAADGTQVARRLLQQLGLQARTVDDLATLPPAGATLVLSAPRWDLFAGTPERVQRWVEAGGHLVVDAGLVPEAGEPGWLPVRRAAAPAHHEDDDDEDTAPRVPPDWCRVLEQRPGLAPAWGDRNGFVACLRSARPLAAPTRPLLWALESEDAGLEALRVAQGRGRVTVFNGLFQFGAQYPRPRLMNLSNRGLLEGDNAALFAALVDAQPGGEVWIVHRLRRDALPLWLARHAAPVLVLAALALAFALWRAGTRFGPLAAPPLPQRRSLAAQVRGLADFLGRHQPQALHGAALRALDEAAQRTLPGWRRLAPPARAAALARRTRLPEARLLAALQPDPAATSDTLALLETARRTLATPKPP